MTSSSFGRLMSPLPQKQTDKSWFTFGYPDRGNSYLRSPHSLTKLVGAKKIYRAFLCITLNPQSGDSSGVMLGVRSVALLHLYLSSLSANNLHKVTMLPNAVVFYIIHFHTTTLSHKKMCRYTGRSYLPCTVLPYSLTAA